MARDPYREASRWFVRLGGAPLLEAEAEAFQRWLAERPENATAWADAELAWSLSGQAAGAASPTPRRAASWRVWAAMAAGIAGLALLIAGGLEVRSRRVDQPAIGALALATAPGEIRRVKLSDGSLVTLDADSALTARLGPSLRQLELTRGRAHFEVAHDLHRPFKVKADTTTVVATGTSFDVNRLPRAIDIVLLRGGVDVVTPGRVVRLKPGEHVLAGGSGDLRPIAVDSEAASGWLQGRLTFQDETLADIAAEMNRYGGARIVIADPKLAQARFSGVFMAGDGATLAESLRAARIGSPSAGAEGTIVISAFATR